MQYRYVYSLRIEVSPEFSRSLVWCVKAMSPPVHMFWPVTADYILMSCNEVSEDMGVRICTYVHYITEYPSSCLTPAFTDSLYVPHWTKELAFDSI